jgi:hypothetical protein
MALALLASAAVHGMVLSTQFVQVNPRLFEDPNLPMEVVLVNAKSADSPLNPDALAQVNLAGGGNTDEDRRLKSPLPASPKTQAGNMYVQNGIAEVTFSQAEVACVNLETELFFVTKDMNVGKLMSDAGISTVWTSIYKSVTTKVFVNNNELPPVTKTKFDNISDENLSLATFDESKAIVLRLKDGKLSYEMVLKTENHRTFCVSPIPFPFKTEDVNSLVKVQSQMQYSRPPRYRRSPSSRPTRTARPWAGSPRRLWPGSAPPPWTCRY